VLAELLLVCGVGVAEQFAPAVLQAARGLFVLRPLPSQVAGLPDEFPAACQAGFLLLESCETRARVSDLDA